MRVVSRAEWGAIKEAQRPLMRLPVRELWLHHSVTRVTDNQCADMLAIQKVGISRYGYISYSFAIHPNGTILEGQGLHVGAHTAHRNSTSFGVVLIGDYTRRLVTTEQVASFRWLTNHLRDSGHLRTGAYPTGGHRDLKATACPGAQAYAIIPQLRLPAPAPIVKEVLPRLSFQIVGTVVDALKAPDGGVWVLTDVGAVYAFECQDHDAPNRHPEYWHADQKAARLEALGAGYRVVDSRGQFYEYPGT